MSDARYFQRGKIQELRTELNSDKGPKYTKKKEVLKRVVANMTMGTDMSPLFADVLGCMNISNIEVKKMVYLYVMNYAKVKPDMAVMAINCLIKDADDPNPLIRALAIRTMGYIQVDRIMDSLCDPLHRLVKDQDPYVRKTAAICIAKVYATDPQICEQEGFITSLKDMLNDANSTVVANAAAALREIADKNESVDLTINTSTASKLITALSECYEWAQVYLLDLLMFCVPTNSDDAAQMAERIAPRLAHANSAVSLTAMKVIMYMMNYIQNDDTMSMLCKKLSPPLVTLLSAGPEIQYTTLKNILLIVQKRPEILRGDIKVFFCKYNDPIYVKLAKLEILIRLVNEENVDQVLLELKEYASEVDVDFVRKSVRCIGRCAIKVELMAEKCIAALVELIQTKVNYLVQEAVIVIRDIFRKYPNKYEGLIATLCEYLDSLDEPEAKSAMVWIIGHYADRIENAVALLDTFVESFLEEPAEVQLAMLTASVKAFLRNPVEGKEVVGKVLRWCTEQVDNPDVRDRGYIYWRLLSTDPALATAIVFSEKPNISTETDNMEPRLLDELLLHIASLSSIYYKPPTSMSDRDQRNAKLLSSRIQALRGSTSQSSSPSAYQNSYQYNPYSIDSTQQQMHMGNMQNNMSSSGNVTNLLDLDFEPDLVESSAPFDTMSNITGVSHSSSLATIGRGVNGGSISNQVTGAYGGNPFAQASSLMNEGGAGFVNSLTDQMNQMNMGIRGQGTNELFSISVQSSYVQAKDVWLQANAGRGLEIQGTFSRRQGQMYMDMTFANRALQLLSDFAMQMNKNAFAIVPKEPLMIRGIPPNRSHEISVRLGIEGLPQPMNPINTIQVAIKNNIGVFYFQCFIPLHVLFTEDGANVDKNEFVRVWKDISEDKTHSFNVERCACNSIMMFKGKLQANNVFLIAERVVDNQNVIYFAIKFADKTMILVEARPDESGMSAYFSVKTHATHLMPLIQPTMEAILTH